MTDTMMVMMMMAMSRRRVANEFNELFILFDFIIIYQLSNLINSIILLFFFTTGVTSMASLLEKDAGFCSGSSEHEDDHHPHDGMHSPTDTSEDSVEVKFTPIQKNKRKSSEPSRVVPDPELGPLKKRFRYENPEHFHTETNLSHFRPWAPSAAADEFDIKPNPADILVRHPGVTTLHRAINTSDIEQEQPLALIAKKPEQQQNVQEPQQQQQHRKKAAIAAAAAKSNEISIESLIKQTQISRLQSCNKQQIEIKKPLPSQPPSSSSASSSSSKTAATTTQKQQGKTSTQRNYKNMTRERRIEANARERTRVHTISAAYDTLRHSIPSYSNSQKLSKLSVLRVACSYILYLSRLNGDDFSADQSRPPLPECVESVTKTIQTEGKLRRKKDE